jgi:hypothetical protein
MDIQQKEDGAKTNVFFQTKKQEFPDDIELSTDLTLITSQGIHPKGC